MLLTLPGLVYLLNLSLGDRAGFSQVTGILVNPLFKLLAVLFCWALSHHILAGIRFMLLDFEVGVERSVARKSAWLVHACAVLITLAVAGLIFGVIEGSAK
jgi:succinate dehydrogenase / fumarate reductase cytochrome b subunit